MASPDFKKFFCRFLQDHGRCRFNEHCQFSHSPTDSYKIPDNVCLYFLKGYCLKPEEECSFLHISADGLIEQLKMFSRYSGDSSVRPSNEPSTSKGTGRSWRDRPDSSVRPSNEPSTSKGTGRSSRDRPDSSGAFKKNYRRKDYDVKPKPREERLCGICLEDVVSSQKSFGLLVNCNHSFCYDCIGQWRKQNNVSESATRSCPECRRPSELVVPSRRFAIDADKAHVIEQYKNRMKDKICKYEKNGRNFCKYRNSCLFKHTLPFQPAAESSSNLILNAIFAESDDFELRIYYTD